MRVAVMGLGAVGRAACASGRERAMKRYDRVILTVGAWTTKIVSELNLPLTVTRQTYAYFALKSGAEAPFLPEQLPVWIEAS